jgi:hypothetical protein
MSTSTNPVTKVGLFSTLTVSGLTANSFLYSGVGGLLTTTSAPTNGQLLIGSTGAAPVAGAITGTANQITVTLGAGTIALSLPSAVTLPGSLVATTTIQGTTITATTAFRAADTTKAAPAYSFTNATSTGSYWTGSAYRLAVSGTDHLQFNTAGLFLQQSDYLGWADIGNDSGTLFLYRDAASTLSQRNGTNAQDWNVYNTYTDATTNESFGINWIGGSNTVFIGTKKGSVGGSARTIKLQVGSTSYWQWDTSGHYVPVTDNVVNIGDASHRVANIFSGIVTIGTVPATGGQIRLGSGASVKGRDSGNANDRTIVGWGFAITDAVELGDAAVRSVLYGTVVGVGGLTSSFPSFKRSSAKLAFRLADDSADAGFTASTGDLSAKLTTYNNVTTAGIGTVPVYASGSSTAQTAAVASVATFTPTADGLFEISTNVNVTTSTTHSFAVQVTYTDEGNTARTLTVPMAQLAGTTVAAITNVTGAGPYEGVKLAIRAKASTAITILTSGTFTSVTYNVFGAISQIQ